MGNRAAALEAPIVGVDRNLTILGSCAAATPSDPMTTHALLSAMTVALLLLAALVLVLNWAAVAMWFRNKRRGFARHYSLVPFAAQVFGIAAAITSKLDPAPQISPWVGIVVAALDVSVWSLAYLPIYLLRRRRNQG